MRERVAVIGAGIFGCTLASLLARRGFKVDLFENKSDILMGATPNSVMRLHLGHHYPRSLETAKQSLAGFSSFKDAYSEAINFKFTNLYAVASVGSKVSSNQFRQFLEAAGLPAREVSKTSMRELGFDTSKIESAFEAPEGVIDPDLLRGLLWRDLNDSGVSVNLQSEVSMAVETEDRWLLSGKTFDSAGPFRFIFRTTYSSDSIEVKARNIPSRVMEFHRTLVVKARIPLEGVGLTVIDGDFLTVLPAGSGSSHLLYGPKPSVVDRFIGQSPPDTWRSPLEAEPRALSEKAVVERYAEWFPDHDVEVITSLDTIRAIGHGLTATDKRVSEVSESSDGFFEVSSGKIDHAIELSEAIASRLTSSLGK